jgi:hypothetical protein
MQGSKIFHLIKVKEKMYCEFTAYCDQNWNINPESLAAISAVLPYADWVTDSGSGGEDESGRQYMCYCIGEDDFYAVDGTTELEGEELDEAEKSNEIEVFEAYLKLLPLEGTYILYIWINDGGQFGKYYTEEYARKRLSELLSAVS